MLPLCSELAARKYHLYESLNSTQSNMICIWRPVCPSLIGQLPSPDSSISRGGRGGAAWSTHGKSLWQLILRGKIFCPPISLNLCMENHFNNSCFKNNKRIEKYHSSITYFIWKNKAFRQSHKLRYRYVILSLTETVCYCYKYVHYTSHIISF